MPAREVSWRSLGHTEVEKALSDTHSPTGERRIAQDPPAAALTRSLGTVRIGWHSASRLSITECKQGSDWLLSSPHRAS